ncbi:MAG: phytanoyl-CoA dioxygenase family protein [Acidimicrobiales bacterium]
MNGGVAVSNAADVAERMLEGFPDLDRYIADHPISHWEQAKLRAALAGIAAYRAFLQRTGRMDTALAHRDAALAAATGFELKTRPVTKPRPNGHYLSPAEITTFERDGIIGPFPLLSPADAADVGALCRELHVNDFRENCFLGPDVVKALVDGGDWLLNYGAQWQAQRIPELWDIVTMPELADRMASLLGDDVICWRSQLFEKRPGDPGTFWHQTAAFRESSPSDKLAAPEGTDPGMIQLSVWVALTDVTVANGALRMVPGTFADGRLEQLYNWGLDNLPAMLASLDPARAEQLLRLRSFSTGSFFKAQSVFEAMIDVVADMFAGREVRDLEMRAGECIIFTSLNVHGSHANSTRSDSRLAFVGRFTTNDVRVWPDMTTDVFSTPAGQLPFPTEPLKVIQVHGTDTFGHNRIATAPTEPRRLARPVVGV